MVQATQTPLKSLLIKVREWLRRLLIWSLEEIEVRAAMLVARVRLAAYNAGLPLEAAVKEVAYG